jgi:hypothetical protein
LISPLFNFSENGLPMRFPPERIRRCHLMPQGVEKMPGGHHQRHMAMTSRTATTRNRLRKVMK